MSHPFNPVIELLLVVATLVALYGLSLLATWWHRPPPRPAPVPAPRHEPPVPAAQDTAPYRGLDGVTFGRADRDHPAEDPSEFPS